MKVPFRITLRAARINKGLSLEEAAEQLGIVKRTLINYEKGITVPNWNTVEKMAEVYGIPVDYLNVG